MAKVTIYRHISSFLGSSNLVTELWVDFVPHSRFSLVISVYILVNKQVSHTISQFVPFLYSPLLSTHLFSMPVFLFLPCKQTICTIFIDATDMCEYIFCICFSLYDLIHSVWQTLGPSMPLQTIQFHSFYDWVKFHYVYDTLSLSFPLLMGTMLLPYPVLWIVLWGRGACVLF